MLCQLLDGACYHMMCVAVGTKVDWDFWNKAMEEELEDHEWVDFLERRGFRAGVDFPISLYYK